MNYRHHLDYQLFSSPDQLQGEDKKLIEEAFTISEKAYAPYSQFRVGAAVRLSDGTIVTGSNQENIAYPSGLCAERVALFYAGSNFPDLAVEVLCVVAKGDLLDFEKLLSPCGACRQVMLETENRQKVPFKVILVSQNNKVLVLNSAADLLPFAFGTIS